MSVLKDQNCPFCTNNSINVDTDADEDPDLKLKPSRSRKKANAPKIAIPASIETDMVPLISDSTLVIESSIQVLLF